MTARSSADLRPSPGEDGDGWAVGRDGSRYWGLHGAAGVLVHDPVLGVLLQLRAGWCDAGGTWGIPGGALRAGESALDGALREAWEEAGITPRDVTIEYTSVFDAGFWTYSTVVALRRRAFTPRIRSLESTSLRWVPAREVRGLELHPGFAATWAELGGRLGA